MRKLIEIITIYELARIITQPSGKSLNGSQAMKYSSDVLFSLSIKKKSSVLYKEELLRTQRQFGITKLSGGIWVATTSFSKFMPCVTAIVPDLFMGSNN